MASENESGYIFGESNPSEYLHVYNVLMEAPKEHSYNASPYK